MQPEDLLDRANNNKVATIDERSLEKNLESREVRIRQGCVRYLRELTTLLRVLA
jgi:hypothetical protein